MSGHAFTLLLAPDVRFLTVGDVPSMTAAAIYPEKDGDEDRPIARAACELNHEVTLAAAIRDGLITPRNRLSFNPEPSLSGTGLKRAVITRADFKRFAALVLIRVKSSPTPECGDAEQSPKWNDERKAALRAEHARLAAQGHKSPTKALADAYSDEVEQQFR